MPDWKQSWLQLEGLIDEAVLRAPKTCGDPLAEGQWPEVDSRIVAYIEKHVIGTPWANYLALLALVATAQRHQPHTIKAVLGTLNPRFREFFTVFGFKTLEDWDADKHMTLYLRGEVLPDHSGLTRSFLWVKYISTLRLVHRWIKSLPEEDRELYRRYVPPLIDADYFKGLIGWAEVRENQRRKRKAETDALVTRFAEIRGEAHFRFNRLSRLRQAYFEVVAEVKKGGHALPFDFSYEEILSGDESAGARERLRFRLWDRKSFVLAHKEHYSRRTVQEAARGWGAFKDPTMFVEFVVADNLTGGAPPEGWWFEELLRRDVLGGGPRYGTPEEVAEKQAWLREWGYGEGSEPGAILCPFKTHEGGVLTDGLHAGHVCFIYRAAARTGCLLFRVEPFYKAAAFGLLAINVITTTGMRINELMQLRVDQECLAVVSMPAPPGALDQSLRVRHVLRVIPKGERAQQLHDYFVSQETVRLMSKVAGMVYEGYGLDIEKGDKLPAVKFSRQSSRHHRFGPARYLFQHDHMHLSAVSLTACMRFLLHNMVFRTVGGKVVVLKAHLLRHAFATHAAQVEGVPLDVLAAILKHKDLKVTDYYSAPTETFVAAETDKYFARIATHVNVRDAILRSPEEIGRMIEEAQGRVGALSNVLGGECVVSTPCIAKFACIGCVGHAPDPEKRYQVEEKQQWAREQIELATERGLTVEVEQMKKLLRDCEAELREMDLIEAYRRDEKREALVQIEGRRKRRG